LRLALGDVHEAEGPAERSGEPLGKLLRIVEVQLGDILEAIESYPAEPLAYGRSGYALP